MITFLFLRPVFLRAVEVDKTAVVAYAQLVSFVSDSNGQGVFRVRVDSVAQDVDPVQVQTQAFVRRRLLFQSNQ